MQDLVRYYLQHVASMPPSLMNKLVEYWSTLLMKLGLPKPVKEGLYVSLSFTGGIVSFLLYAAMVVPVISVASFIQVMKDA